MLLAPEQQRPCALASTGAAIWHVLDQPRTTDAIVTELAELFAAEPSQIEPDVTSFLSELAELGVVTTDG